jgi:hypothetical protein
MSSKVLGMNLSTTLRALSLTFAILAAVISGAAVAAAPSASGGSVSAICRMVNGVWACA